MFGLRKWPTPFVKPLWPFLLGGAITFASIWKIQNSALESPAWAHDPKNPYAKGSKEEHH